MPLDALSLTALLSSRLCHDLISPVSAFSTGIEVLQDETDDDMRAHAMELLDTSSKQATAKLEFLRLTFGAAGALGHEVDRLELKRLADGYAAYIKPEIDWRLSPGLEPKDQCKILLNLLLIALESVPRGGTVTVEDAALGIELRAEGPRARFNEASRIALDGETAELDAKSVQPYLTGELIRAAGKTLDIDVGDEKVVFVLK